MRNPDRRRRYRRLLDAFRTRTPRCLLHAIGAYPAKPPSSNPGDCHEVEATCSSVSAETEEASRRLLRYSTILPPVARFRPGQSARFPTTRPFFVLLISAYAVKR